MAIGLVMKLYWYCCGIKNENFGKSHSFYFFFHCSLLSAPNKFQSFPMRPPSLRSQESYDGQIPPFYYHQPRAVSIASRRPPIAIRGDQVFQHIPNAPPLGSRPPSNPPSVRSKQGPFWIGPSSNPPSVRSIHGPMWPPSGSFESLPPGLVMGTPEGSFKRPPSLGNISKQSSVKSGKFSVWGKSNSIQ